MSEYFSTSLEHLLAELGRIELKLQIQVMKLRQHRHGSGEDDLRGLYISDADVDSVLSRSPLQAVASASQSDGSELISLKESLSRLVDDIIAKEEESRRRGVVLRLHELRELFNLTALDTDALLVCVLPELDLRYQRVYGYLQDDMSQKSPTVDLVLRLLYDSLADRLSAREVFSSESPLIKNHLLRWQNRHPQKVDLLLGRSLQVDERITDYLLGIDRIDSSLLACTRLVHPEVSFSDIALHEDIGERLGQLAGMFRERGIVSYFKGSYGAGRKAAAEAIAHQLRVPLLIIDFNSLPAADIPVELALSLVFREGRLQNAVVYLDNCDEILKGENGTVSGYESLIRELAAYPRWAILAGEQEWQPVGSFNHKPFIGIEFDIPSHTVRKQLWAKQWNGNPPVADESDIVELAGRFRLSGGQIRDAAATARNLALWRAPDDASVNVNDLYRASRKQSGQGLNTLACHIHPRYGWDDIILPKDQMEQLHEICGYIKHYHTVYSGWGFGQKLARGKGLDILFAGPSGTGKTMAADIMANELGIDLYKIDLSAIVSKYIGETEKNLDRIFREGQTANAILFFDEADALFGKRSEVRDSHDRYANIEVAYLLQKMEEYDGVVILATNLRKNIDDAFARRMHFAIEFPMPEESDRRRIWEGVFPREAPLDVDIDLAFLARQFRITGGNIKNIALSAAFLAAQNGGHIDMENLIKATKREYQKMGRLCTEGDFAQYFELVKG